MDYKKPINRNNEQTLSETLKTLVGRRELSSGYNQQRIKNWWKEAMGNLVDRQTRQLRFRDGNLLISVESASLRSELNMSRNQLKDRINEYLGEEVVTTVEVR